MTWYKQNKFVVTYYGLTELFSTVRSPDKGKPLSRWLRLFKVGDTFELHGNFKRIAVVTPDSVITFVAEPHVIAMNAGTFVTALHRSIPYVLHRKSKGLYALGSSDQMVAAGLGYNIRNYLQNHAPEYFAGIKFDSNGKCLNAKPNLLDTIDDSVRLEWLRDLRKFKRAIKVRAKLGVFDTLLQARDSRNNRIPNWDTPEWSNAVVKSMRSQEIPTSLLSAFVDTAPYGNYWARRGSITVTQVVETVDAIFKSHSVQLRKAYGVFNRGNKSDVCEVRGEDDCVGQPVGGEGKHTAA
jgi:hypothetical protein